MHRQDLVLKGCLWGGSRVVKGYRHVVARYLDLYLDTEEY